MNLKAEARKIQSLNKEELRKYEAENKRLLEEARAEVRKAEDERASFYKRSICYSGKADEKLIKTVLAYSKVEKLQKLNSEIQKRKLSFLTPQEKRARERKRQALLKAVEELRA